MPSITIWSRLEPRTRERSMERGLQAHLRDPGWLLARQWQVGEFFGDDAGSPVTATVRTRSFPLTSFRPGRAGVVQPLEPTIPIEGRVEAEPFRAGLGDAIALGIRFEALLQEEGAAPHAPAFRAAFPIAAA